MRAHHSDHSANLAIQDGDARAQTTKTDAYMQELFNQFTWGQVQARNGLTGEINFNNATFSDSVANTFAGPSPASNVSVTQAPQTQSWRDPQIYLASVMSGKSASSHYHILDFVSGNVEEENSCGWNSVTPISTKSRA